MLIAIFYFIYFSKMLLQRKRGIKTNQMGANNSGTKDKKTTTVERVMKLSSYSIVVVQIISIILGKAVLGYTGRGILLKVFGSYLALAADIIFLLSVVTMKDSWRAGIADGEKTKLVTSGIYRFSRNPAFLAFDLLHTGILLMYFNPVLLVFTIWAEVMLHLQILQEEKYLEKEFKEEYTEYKKSTGRYYGIGKCSLKKIALTIYIIGAYFSVLYYFTCVAYAGFNLSFVWIWPMFAVFCAFRIVLIWDKISSKEFGTKQRFKIPKLISVLYRICFAAVFAIFMFVEINVLVYMNMQPQDNLDYVIVLGAGLRGDKPTRPLYLRIQKAYNYMMRNPDTILIASGGQGPDEIKSEAEVIYTYLVDMGIDPDRIILEDKSTSTIENISNSYAFIEEGANVGIVTNGFHLYRTTLIVDSQGYDDICGIPAQTMFPVGIHYIVREFFGVVQLTLGLDL